MFGISLNNSGNKRVIGSDTTVPRFVGKYNRDTWSVDDRTGKHLVFSVNCPEMPLCFINTPAGKAASVGKITGSSGAWSVYILVPYQTIDPDDVTMYAFSGGYTTESASGYGIKIKKSSGEVAFDTGYKHVMLRKVFYGKDRGSTTVFDWPVEGIIKPSIMCNTWGSGYNYSSYIPTKYILFPIGGWLAMNMAVFFTHWKDHIHMFSDGFAISSYTTLEGYPGWTGVCGVDWDYTRSGAAISCSGPFSIADQYNVHLSVFNTNKALTAYTWGSPTGDKDHTDVCVGDPTGVVGSPWSPTGIDYYSVPPSAGAYDIFIIDGDDYD
jgi:hypothetical protein